MSLFKRAAFCTDIHFGLKGDSEIHNSDCIEFLEWFCQQTRLHECDTVIFLGDWLHNRTRTENRTMYYSQIGIEILDSLNLPVFWLLGNHDIYLKNSRDVHPLKHIHNCKNIQLIEKITQIDDVVFSPWLVCDEHLNLIERKCKYIFGHFELPFFLMNQVIEKVYDGNGLHIDDFENCEAVYSGHFHRRQIRVNKNKIPIYYLGNAFSHDLNDVNDHDRGMAFLEHGQTLPTYIAWPDAPTYNRYNISDFLKMMKNGQNIHSKATIELIDDLDLPADTANELKEVIEARLVKIRRQKQDIIKDNKTTDARTFNSLDEMVEHKLRTLHYDGNYSPDLMVELYKSL